MHTTHDSKASVTDNPLLNIMKKDVYTIQNNESIADALQVMSEKKVSGLPVVDKNEHLVGFISDGDIIRHLSSEHSLFINSDSFEKLDFNIALNKILAKEVSSLAEKRVYTVNVTDDLGEVCYKLAENGLKKAPVMQGEKMVGIINASNIIKYAVSMIKRK
jgi:DHA2 family lincomycin resistance protein-like MFS transporter